MIGDQGEILKRGGVNPLLAMDTAHLPFKEGSLPHTMYFSPSVSGCSGLFIAKIHKPHRPPHVPPQSQTGTPLQSQCQS